MRSPDFIIGGKESPYMLRWWLIPRNRWFNVYLHHILRDDDDRALHDHPWVNLSVILRGGYRELMFAWRPKEGIDLPPLVERERRPFLPVLRRAHLAHRIILNRDSVGNSIACWSLFITGPSQRSWGFWCSQGRWVHWRLFTAGPNGEVVGKGCDE